MANIRVPNSGNIVITGTISGSGDNVSLGTKTITLNTKDTYVYENIDVVVSASAAVGSATLGHAATSGVTYTDETSDATIIPSGGYLYIDQGWIGNTKISLSHLIPEIASNDAGDDHIRAGFKAYDEQGNVLTGTINDVTPSFTGGTVSVTASVSSYTAPTVTHTATGKFLPTGSGNVGANYGVTTTQPSGSDGINFLSIDCFDEYTPGSVKALAEGNRTAVTYNGAAKGYINVASGTIALSQPAMSPTDLSDAQSIVPTITDNFTKLYIPIVSPAGTGGTLTVNSGSIQNLSGTAPSVTPTASGTFTTASTYGVTTTQPSGTDGTNYLKLTPSGTASAGSYTANVSLNYSRAAVTAAANYKGAVNIASGATLLAASNNQTATQNGVSVGTIQATVGTAANSYYIPITTLAANGGALSDGTIGFTTTGAITITPSTGFYSRSGGTDSSTAITLSTYGITANPGSTGTYVKFDPGASVDNDLSIDASIEVTRAAITVSGNPGATNGTGTGISSTSKTYTGLNSVSTSVGSGTNYYVPVITVPSTSSVSNSVSNPTVDLTAGAAYGGTGAPSGSVSGFTSTQPSGAYVVITPGKNVTSGTVTSTVSSITINEGITAGGTISGGTDTDNIGVTNGTTTNYYVKIYDGTYTVA